MTEIIRASHRIAAKNAASVLRKGGIIIYPTETQYGMGADVANRKAVKKIFVIKQRPEEKKIIWAFSDVAMIKKYFKLDRQQEKLCRALMPGPFTLVISGQAFRIPDNDTARKIIRKFGMPVTTTSANISGRKAPAKIKEIIKLFDGKVDVIIDGGDLPARKPSTVFDWETKIILRKGPVSRKGIEKALHQT